MSNVERYQEIAETVLDKLDEGTVPWKQSWETGFIRPRSVATGEPYTGWNTFALHLQGYDSPWWLTYNRAQKLGGHVRKGESGTSIYYWNFRTIEKEVEVENEDGETETETVEDTIPLVKKFTVFNIEQVADLPDDWREQAGLPEPNGDADGVDPHEKAEAIVENMPEPPTIEREKQSPRAYYSPPEDHVRVPCREQYDKVESYYSTLFHELGHSTGHESRLNRSELMDNAERGNEDYSREELVAEFTSAFLAADAGLSNPDELEQSAAYIDHWRETIKDEPGIIMSAAGRAEKAARYIRGEYEEQDGEEDE